MTVNIHVYRLLLLLIEVLICLICDIASALLVFCGHQLFGCVLTLVHVAFTAKTGVSIQQGCFMEQQTSWSGTKNSNGTLTGRQSTSSEEVHYSELSIVLVM